MLVACLQRQRPMCRRAVTVESSRATFKSNGCNMKAVLYKLPPSSTCARRRRCCLPVKLRITATSPPHWYHLFFMDCNEFVDVDKAKERVRPPVLCQALLVRIALRRLGKASQAGGEAFAEALMVAIKPGHALRGYGSACFRGYTRVCI